MNNIAIMQPYFLPYIGYWQLMDKADHFILLDDVNFKKGGWINRNTFLVNGEHHQFTLPISKVSQNKKICDLTIIKELAWKNNFYKTLKMSYQKSPFLDEIFEKVIDPIFSISEVNLSKFLEECIRQISNTLKIKCKISRSSDYFETKQYAGQDRIIKLCIANNATRYLNLPGGKLLYSTNAFLESDIILEFFSPKIIEYHQYQSKCTIFKPSLSILDILINTGIEFTEKLVKQHN